MSSARGAFITSTRPLPGTSLRSVTCGLPSTVSTLVGWYCSPSVSQGGVRCSRTIAIGTYFAASWRAAAPESLEAAVAGGATTGRSPRAIAIASPDTRPRKRAPIGINLSERPGRAVRTPNMQWVRGAARNVRARARRGAAALVPLAALIAALAVAPAPATATAKVPKGAVKKLAKSPCPPKYAVRVSRPADSGEIATAKNGNFSIAGRKVHIGRKMDWTYDPVGSASFRARLHDLRWLDPLFYAYRERGDRTALRTAKRIVVDWVKSNPLREPTTDRTWFDKVAGDRGPYIAYATRAAMCEGLLKNSGLARKLLGSVQQHIRFLADPPRYSPTNRGLFMDLGLIFSGRQMRFLPGAGKARKQGQRRFVGNVNRHVIWGEGMWLEHSTTYQFLTVNAIERFLEIDSRNRPGLERLLETMKETAAWMTMPDRRWVQAGDSFQDKSARFAQQLGREQRGMRVLPASGIAFVKKKKSYLSLLSNYHSDIHRHSDDLSFDLYEDGHRIVSDTGIPDKDFGAPYEFAISGPAHSIVEVDGADFPRDAGSAYGSGILASGAGHGWYAIEAVNPLVAEQGVAHNRLLLYKPGRALVVADQLRSNASHSYRSFFQFGPDFGLQLDDDRMRLHAGSDRVFVYSESSDPELRRDAVRGRLDPLAGFVYTDFRDREPRWTASTTTSGPAVDNVTTFALNPRKQVRASAVGQLGETSSFAISHNGDPKKIVTVTRKGDRLSIATADPPYTPVP